LTNGESDDGGLGEFREFCPQLPPQLGDLSLKPRDLLSLSYDQSSQPS
jgi:hypothetical protein